MCKSRKDLCIYGSWVACQTCNQRKVRCSFLGGIRKRKNDKIDSEEDEELTPKKTRVGGSKPSGSQPTVEIPGPSQAAKQLVNEMVVLLRELVEGVQELTKVTRGVSGLRVQIYQQNAKLIRLGERQSYLAKKALKGGLGLVSETEAERSGKEEAKKDKGKGKAKVTEDKEETMKSDGVSEEEEEEEDDERMREYVGSAVSDSEKEK
jgi:hypothetical protein